MRRNLPSLRTELRAAVAVAFLLVPLGAQAHTFEAPAFVHANRAGAFRYAATFTAGSGGAFIGYWEKHSGTNTDIGAVIADFFAN